LEAPREHHRPCSILAPPHGHARGVRRWTDRVDSSSKGHSLLGSSSRFA
jgi:hypothetical protein